MFATIIAWIYITYICWLWGVFVTICFNKIDKANSYNPHFSITCLLGLSFLQVLFSYFSLLGNLSSLNIHLGIIAISLFISLILYTRIKKDITFFFPKLHLSIWILLTLSLLVILTMSTWHILHPDTQIYHAAIIKSIEQNGIVIGHAQEKYHYGLNSSWFLVCGLFSFKFLDITALTFINSTLVFWFLVFIIDKVQQSFNNSHKLSEENSYIVGILWLLLLSISFLDYTQIRLTVTSASPDFIAAIYIWTIFYIHNNIVLSKPVLLLLIFLSVVSITIKASVFIISIYIAYILYILFKKSIKYVALALLIILTTLLPIVLRNILTSGYAFFPASFPNIFNVDWKLEESHLHYISDYVRAYARTQSESDPESIKKVINMRLYKWITIWWKHKSITQQIMMILLIFSLIFNLYNLKSFYYKGDKKEFTTVTISILGVITWFILAPDPRFGLGFILPCSSIPLYYTFLRFTHIKSKKILVSLVLIISSVLALYLIHRFTHYFHFQNFIVPSGLN